MGDGGEPGGWLTKVLVLVVVMVLAAKRKLVWPWANGGCDRRERTNERVLLVVSPFAAIVTRIWLNTAGLVDLKSRCSGLVHNSCECQELEALPCRDLNCSQTRVELDVIGASRVLFSINPIPFVFFPTHLVFLRYGYSII